MIAGKHYIPYTNETLRGVVSHYLSRDEEVKIKQNIFKFNIQNIKWDKINKSISTSLTNSSLFLFFFFFFFFFFFSQGKKIGEAGAQFFKDHLTWDNILRYWEWLILSVVR